MQYIHLTSPRELWQAIQTRFNHQTLVALPRACQEWLHLRVQDVMSIKAYNNELYRITSTLTLCKEPIKDADLLEKTLSTFHSSNLILATQYRNMKFGQYSELVSHLLVVEKQQELLLHNSEMQPPSTLPNHQQLETQSCNNQTSAFIIQTRH